MAGADFEQISIARFSKAAGISVGAFYVRFKDKDAFLDFVIANTFAEARTAFQEQANIGYVPNLADALVRQFSSPEFSGIVRAAVKLGFLAERHRAPYDEYRRFVSQYLAELLLADVKKRERRQRIAAIDAALAILTQSALFPNSEIDLQELETLQVIVDLLSGNTGGVTLLASKKQSSSEPKNKLPKSPRDPESLRKPNKDTVKTSELTRGSKKI